MDCSRARCDLLSSRFSCSTCSSSRMLSSSLIFNRCKRLTCCLFLEICVERWGDVHEKGVSLKEHSVSASRHDSGNFTGNFDTSKVEVGRWAEQLLSKELCGSSFTLSLDNCRFFVLDGLVDEELCTLGLLLSDLFLFNSLCELGAEMQVCNRYIIKHDVKVFQTQGQTLTDACWDLFSLSEKLSGIVPCNDGLEYLVDNRG